MKKEKRKLEWKLAERLTAKEESPSTSFKHTGVTKQAGGGRTSSSSSSSAAEHRLLKLTQRLGSESDPARKALLQAKLVAKLTRLRQPDTATANPPAAAGSGAGSIQFQVAPRAAGGGVQPACAGGVQERRQRIVRQQRFAASEAAAGKQVRLGGGG